MNRLQLTNFCFCGTLFILTTVNTGCNAQDSLAKEPPAKTTEKTTTASKKTKDQQKNEPIDKKTAKEISPFIGYWILDSSETRKKITDDGDRMMFDVSMVQGLEAVMEITAQGAMTRRMTLPPKTDSTKAGSGTVLRGKKDMFPPIQTKISSIKSHTAILANGDAITLKNDGKLELKTKGTPWNQRVYRKVAKKAGKNGKASKKKVDIAAVNHLSQLETIGFAAEVLDYNWNNVEQGVTQHIKYCLAAIKNAELNHMRKNAYRAATGLPMIMPNPFTVSQQRSNLREILEKISTGK